MSPLQAFMFFVALPLALYGLVAMCSDVLILLRDDRQ